MVSTTRDRYGDFGWSPTIAFSWLWGFALVVSYPIVVVWGLPGLAAFAVPYSLGLVVFGSVFGNAPRRYVEVYKRLQGQFLGLLLFSQTLIVAVTLFATTKGLFIPLFGPSSVAVVALLVLLAASVGHSTPMRGLKALHVAGLLVATGCAGVVVAGLIPSTAGSMSADDLGTAAGGGVAIPAFIGLLLGPWADARLWRVATEIHREGGSTRLAFGGGAILFLGIAALNAVVASFALAHNAGPELSGTGAGEVFVANAVSGLASPALKGAFAAWGGLALMMTVATSYGTISALLKSAASTSVSPLLAFLPTGLVTSPLWFLVCAALAALTASEAHIQGFWLVVPFATLFVGPMVCLICEAIGGGAHYDGVLCGLIGAASLLIFAIGYVGDLPSFMLLAPLIGGIGAAPAIQALFRKPGSPASEPAEVTTSAALPLQTIDVVQGAAVVSHGFDGQWFVLHITPTYDDTNSVGNVYFANYFRWVGKARELFFNACMPDFDLSTTDFYVLTKSFTHEFRREMREFQPLSVRVRIGAYNRKFVTIEHEIQSVSAGLVGRGEQTIMFVDTVRYRPIDIPAIILQRFLPYYVPNAAAVPRDGRTSVPHAGWQPAAASPGK